MAFNREGNWTAPEPSDTAKWVDELINSEAHEGVIDITPELQEKLDAAIRSKSYQYENIEYLNKTSYKTLASVATETNKVSVVIPIYGAFNLVKQCVESVLKHSYWPFELILVDDCSPDPLIRDWLLTVKASGSCVEVKTHFNKKNKGFAPTCNVGINAATGKYICVLNSDVLVTPYWLTKMVTAVEADPSHVIVNPVTNNTALINIPMEPGRSYLDMNRVLERKSPKNYPEIMPTGFCLFFKKELADKLGGFDEAFVSYGEDTHYWFQALKLTDADGRYLSNKAVMADDCYIYHERSSSFAQTGAGEHMARRKAGSERFHLLNPSFAQWRTGYNLDKVLGPLKTAPPEDLYDHHYIYNIAWVVKSAVFCGGMKYICDIANALIEKNVNVKICVIKNTPDAPEVYMNELHTAPVFFNGEEDFVKNFSTRCFTNGIVMAAVAEMVNPVGVLCSRMTSLTPIHHVQSYDPLLTSDPVQAKEMHALYGKLKYTVSSSNWIAELLINEHKIENILFSVQPGVDTDTFHVGNREAGDERFTVMVSLDKQYPFKGYDRGVSLCKELTKQNKNIRIFGLGVDFLPECPNVIGLGKLPQSRLAHLLRTEVDVFVDPSHIHSYGLPSLEALACGVEIVCWDNKGVLEYADNTHTGVHIFKEGSIVTQLTNKIAHISTHKTTPDVSIFSREASVQKFIQLFETNLGLTAFKKRITVVTPHARKHGGPTTIINLANVLHYLGHDVRLVSIYDDFNTEVISFKRVPLYVGINNIKESDVIIINSDNPFIEEIVNQPALKDAKRVLLKLSHNPRFKAIEEASLRMPIWDKIITSTEHLREKTIAPIPDWKHIAWDKDKVQTVGWYHYTFPVFNTPPNTRLYGDIKKQMRVAYLIHDHPTKGTACGTAIVTALKKKYEANVDIIAFGEVALKTKPPWVNYIYKGTRTEMATVMKQCDIWLGCSHSEGLGRMTLEAMASGCAVVTTDTGADFLKDKENCLLYPIGNAQAGAEAVDSMLTDRSLLDRIAAEGYNTAVKTADPQPFISNIRNLIYELCQD